MARLPRYTVIDQPQHVIQRGNNRCVTFADHEDYRFYLDCLADAVDRHRCDLHAYVLMTNHVHLLLTTHERDSVGKVMQSIGRRYVQYFNRRYQRTGTLWEGRYKATLIDSEQYLLSCYRYIELNPVRAGMRVDAAEYIWSSHHHHALGEANPLIKDHALYLALGPSAAERESAYRALCGTPLEQSDLDSIRHATNKGWALGNERFKEELARLDARRVAPLPKGRPRKTGNNPLDGAEIESDPT